MLKFLRWIPAIIVMAVIFVSSSTASTNLPNYGIWDTLVKKSGHVTGYGLLALTYWFGFSFDRKKSWQAWFLALAYAVSDEIHQSFTPGRHPSPLDVLLFDGGGAALSLYCFGWILRWKNSKTPERI